MERYDIIGIQRKQGTYDGKEYDNYVFSVIRPADTKNNEQGSICSVIKVKTSSLDIIPNIGDTISPVYNRYGQVQSITIC